MTTFARPTGMRLSSPHAYRATTSPTLAQDKATIERLNQQFTAAFSKVDFGAVAAMYIEDAYLPPWHGNDGLQLIDLEVSSDREIETARTRRRQC
jgi:hypothetical protein